ncbi:alpha/beta hydrolase [Thermodesulfobacteriota bacterium]
MPLSKEILELLKSSPPPNILGVEGARKAREEMQKIIPKVDFPGGAVEDRMVNTAKRETPVRIYTPGGVGPHPALIYMHGGGFIMGDLESHDPICRYIAKTINCVVINVDYGLAPEHKFPEPVEECYEIAKWVRQKAKDIYIDPGRIAVAGDSAGGNLSTVLCLLARDSGDISFVYQVLFYPPTDLFEDPESKFEHEELRLTPEDVAFFNRCYLRDPEDGKNPLASPLLADNLTELPPALVITAERDPLKKEGERYAKRLADAGVEIIHKRYPIIHGFISFLGLVEEAEEALAFACGELSKAFTL